MFVAPAAHAESALDEAGVTTNEVEHALKQVDDDLLKESVLTGALQQGGLVPGAKPADAEDVLQVDIPASAEDGISLTAGDFSLDISLPHAADARHGESLADGIVAYPSGNASANAVVPTNGGVQLLSIIKDQSASEYYSYNLTMPDGHRLDATADGGAQIVDAEGAIRVFFEPAWAEDAKGNSVPTHYQVQGNTLTQVVTHKGLEDVVYPVVADPVPVIVLVLTTIAMVVVAAGIFGVATWVILAWWNTCRAQGKYPELSTRNGFTARCVY